MDDQEGKPIARASPAISGEWARRPAKSRESTVDETLLARADAADRQPSKVDIGKMTHAERDARLYRDR